MSQDIEVFASEGVSGVSFGVLNRKGKVVVGTTGVLIDGALRLGLEGMYLDVRTRRILMLSVFTASLLS